MEKVDGSRKIDKGKKKSKIREQNRNTPKNMNAITQKEQRECQGAGENKGGSVIPFPLSRARKPEQQQKPHAPPQLEVIEGGRGDQATGRPGKTTSADPAYHHSQLGIGHHCGKPWEVEREMRRRLGLPPREVTEVVIAYEKQFTRPDGIQVTVQLTQRALERMREEISGRMHVPTDIPEHAE